MDCHEQGCLLQNGEKESRGLIECDVMQELVQWAMRPYTSVKPCMDCMEDTKPGPYEKPCDFIADRPLRRPSREKRVCSTWKERVRTFEDM